LIPDASISVAFCIPGDLTLPTGGYRYDRELLARLPARGFAVSHVRLSGAYPSPDASDIAATAAALGTLPRDAVALIDGLALGAMPPPMIAKLPHPVVALVHHPLGLESGIPPQRAAALLANERAVLGCVRHSVTTSRATRRYLIDAFGLAESAVTVAEPGVERAPRASGEALPLRLLAVGAVSHRKAYPVLMQALAKCRDLDWRLTIAGSLTLDPAAAADLRRAVDEAGVSDRVDLGGAVEEVQLAALYAEAHVFVASSLYEGYGMALTEALARGLPIVASSGGAAAETLPDAAAIKTAPGDVEALAGAIRRVVSDADLRRRMSDAAWAAAADLPTWDDTARIVAEVLRAAVAPSAPRRSP